MLIPDGLKRRFGHTRLVEQIHRTQTHEGGARDHTIGVPNTLRPECLGHSPQLLIYIVLRDLVQVSANNRVRPPIEPVRDKFRETFPVATRDLLERHNRYDRVRVRCHEAEERFKIELGETRSGVIIWQQRKPHITETFTDTLVVNQSQLRWCDYIQRYSPVSR